MNKLSSLLLFVVLAVPSLSQASWESAEVNLRQAFENHAMAPAPAAPSALGNPEIPTGPTTPPSQPSVAGPSAPAAASAGPAAPVKGHARFMPAKKWWQGGEGDRRAMGLGVLTGIAAGVGVGLAVAAANPAGWAVLAGLGVFFGVFVAAWLLLSALVRLAS